MQWLCVHYKSSVDSLVRQIDDAEEWNVFNAKATNAIKMSSNCNEGLIQAKLIFLSFPQNIILDMEVALKGKKK